jgi:hypothetical protein
MTVGVLLALNSRFRTALANSATVFHTLLKINFEIKKYTFKNESICPLRKFEENPSIFKNIS